MAGSQCQSPAIPVHIGQSPDARSGHDRQRGSATLTRVTRATR
jgi:hypothetical protein